MFSGYIYITYINVTEHSIVHKSTGNYQLFYNNLLTLLILHKKADYTGEPITQYITVCTLTKMMKNSLTDYLTNIPLTEDYQP